jgi:hypothetical protein
MKRELYWHIFKQCSNTKFYENPSSGIRVFPWRRADRQTDMAKLIAAFQNFANVFNINLYTYVISNYIHMCSHRIERLSSYL